MAMAAPMPLAAPVTSATAPSKRNGSVFMSLEAGFEARLRGAEGRLDVHDAELAIFAFALRRHHPDEVDRVAGTRNVRVVALGNDDGIAVRDHADEFGGLAVGVRELDAVGGRRHVEENVELLE